MQKTWHAYKKPYFFLLTSKNLSTSDIPCSEVIKKKKKKSLEMAGCSLAVF